MKKMELLAPAGSYESFVAAINAGADAVYAAGSLFGARAFAQNFTQEELLRAIDYAHLHQKKLYLTVNTLQKPDELHTQLDPFLAPLYTAGLDGVIVQDPGVFLYLHKYYPELPLHVSTQMTVTGTDGALLLKQCGAQRIVPARELLLAEIAAIRQESGLEVEVFVHGALCYCYSGQCFFSSLLGGRSGNRGRCAQPCRLPYAMNKKSGKLLSPKDLCALTLLPDLWEAGVDSLKIEGRMKSAAYTAGVVSIYRKYLELLYADPQHYKVEPADLNMLQTIYDRGGNGTTTGYFHRHNGADMINPSPARTVENSAAKKKIASQDVSAFDTAGLQPFTKEQPAVSVDGMVSLYTGQAVSLSLWNDTVQITVTGDVVQEAKKQPLAKEAVTAQLKKTGGTFYHVNALYCEMDASVFLPKQALNSLRRAALDALSEALLGKFRRKLPEQTAEADTMLSLSATDTVCEFYNCKTDGNTDVPHEEKPSSYTLAASVETNAQFAAAVTAEGVSRIDLDAAMITDKSGLSKSKAAFYAEEIRKQQKQLFLRFPPIFRAQQRTRYANAADWLSTVFDGFVVRSIDSYAFCLAQFSPEIPLCCDFTIYAFQTEAAAFWRQGGINLHSETYPAENQAEPNVTAFAGSETVQQKPHRILLTAPIELNAHELVQNRGLYDELIVYGRYPMMVSANCLAKTTGQAFCTTAHAKSCIPGETVLYLSDRYRKQFPVKPFCSDCYNVIYNSLPLSLLHDRKAISRIGAATLRLLFTTENKEQTAQVLSCFYKTMLSGQTPGQDPAFPFAETTRGHFKRGVD